MESKLEKFAALFKSIAFDICIKEPSIIEEELEETSKKHQQSPETNDKVKVELSKALQRAKSDLASAKKLFKQGKLSNDDLLEYEWRVYEIKEQLDQIDNDYDDEEIR